MCSATASLRPNCTDGLMQELVKQVAVLLTLVSARFKKNCEAEMHSEVDGDKKTAEFFYADLNILFKNAR